MRIAVLSRNKNLHSVRRLLKECRARRVECDVINPLECQLVVDGKQSRIVVAGRILPHYDAILPRIGASITEYGLAVVQQFETMGVFTVNSCEAIAQSRDKMSCLQILAGAGLRVPKTVLTRSRRSLENAVNAVNGLPTILKVLQGTQGVGVMLIHTPISLGSVFDTLQGLGQDVMIQQFIAEAAGRDYRAFVVGDRVVAAMMRTAPEGEFRSNIHRGGQGQLVRLKPEIERAAVRAAKKLGLLVAGVDLMESDTGPLVIEVNSSPGFEGIERATGLNIAGMIIQFIKKEANRRKRSRRRI
ncbi:MAG: RimK family alpha-L-glutamate ligase [Oligoflexia bacterium]|nr:RimK family alpha-L-glutamate ligase [Oligoflexia bacterium]